MLLKGNLLLKFSLTMRTDVYFCLEASALGGVFDFTVAAGMCVCCVLDLFNKYHIGATA